MPGENPERLYKRIREINPLDEIDKVSPQEAILRAKRMFDEVTKDQPGKASGTEIRSNIRDRFCDGSKCPLREAFGNLVGVDLRRDSKKIRNICRQAGLKPANSYYGKDIPNQFESQARQYVFTADCAKHTGDEEYDNYTNCGSLMISDLRMQQISVAEVSLSVQAIRSEWVLNNSDFTNPPKK